MVLAPDDMCERIVPQSSIHSYKNKLGMHGSYAIPKRNSISLNKFSYTGCKIWK